MAFLLRQIVAGPRARHPEAKLDLCYVTDNIIATSGPSSTYPQRAYRNPTDSLVKFLDSKHGANWSIWEFRAEGTGYPDSEVYNRIRHYPWPDHHPPPFALIPSIMASMRNWLKEEGIKEGERVVVVHCKAGKGRSGTITCSYLISEEKWKPQDAMNRFTERRMRSGFGNGISIPSQLRWINYVERWTHIGKTYIERPVEIVEIHAWGLREGVKLSIAGYIEDGRRIKVFHIFKKDERIVIDGKVHEESLFAEITGYGSEDGDLKSPVPKVKSASEPSLIDESHLLNQPTKAQLERQVGTEAGGEAVIFRPKTPILLPSSDVCIDLEKRNRATYGWTMVTAVAHVWFNVYFEGFPKVDTPNSPPVTPLSSADRGVFNIEWEALDGLKGSSRKGTKALDKLSVVWKTPSAAEEPDSRKVINEPAPGEPVEEPGAADWEGKDAEGGKLEPGRGLGLHKESELGKDVSKASSIQSGTALSEEEDDPMRQVKVHGIETPVSQKSGESSKDDDHGDPSKTKPAEDSGSIIDKASKMKVQGDIATTGVGKIAGIIQGFKDYAKDQADNPEQHAVKSDVK